MRYLSLFSGIEACSVAWHDFGTSVAFSEIEPFPCAVLAHHYPNVSNLGDVTKITERQIKDLGPIDTVVFGSPCQDLSVAGKRKGLIDADGDTTRSGLFFTAINIINWARKHCGLRFALWENVPGAFSSSKGRDFTEVVKYMAGLDELDTPANGWGTEGCALGTQLVEWAVLDAQWFGVPQRRRRVFAIADFGDWTGRTPILLERESLRGDTPPSRKTGESFTHATAPCLTSSGRGVARTGDTRGQDPVIAERNDKFGRFDLIGGFDNENNAHGTHEPTGPLLKGSPSGGGRPLPDIVFGVGESPEVGHCLRSGASKADKHESTTYIVQHAGVCYPIDTQNMGEGHNSGGKGFGENNDPSFTLTKGHSHAVAFTQNTRDEVRYINGDGEIAGALAAQPGMKQTTYLHTKAQVRRLTPTECARLQGFPDNYLDIQFRNKPAADGNKYKALGNSMAVPVMRYIGRKIKTALDESFNLDDLI